MIVLVAQLHSASSRGISEGLHTPYVLIRPKSTIIGTLLFIGGDAHDGLGDVVLTIGPDCVDSGFFLCLHLSGKARVTGEQERIHSSLRRNEK